MDADQRGELAAVAISFYCISLISVFLRIFTRLTLVKRIGTDDILIVLAQLSATAEMLGVRLAINYGLGRPISLQTKEQAKPYQQTLLTSSMCYSVTAMFIKLSLLTFYLRLSPNNTFRVLTIMMIVITIGFGIASVVAVGVQCIPLSLLWDPDVEGSCFDVNAFYFANAGIHIITEIAIYVLPIPTLWKLQLPERQKIGLCGIMGVGAMLIVISCYRVATLHSLLNSKNSTLDVVNPLQWYSIEINLAIFIACGPAFLAFFRHYLPIVFGGSSSRTKYMPDGVRQSYPLTSFGEEGTRTRNGTKTTVTASTQPRKAPANWYDNNNSSEEEIIVTTEVVSRLSQQTERE